jgi:serine/threonine protein kinase
LTHPPENTPVPDNVPARCLRLLKELSCERCTGAKVFSCVVDGNERQTLVAKIYDPLYYAYVEDVAWQADKDYSVEAGAYEDIWDLGLDGKYSPKYYGSWAIQVPFSASPLIERTVCLVLMEHLEGFTIHSLMKKELTDLIPPSERLEIMGQVLEIYSKLEFAGVRHCDLAPRNVMLANLDLDHYKPPRTVLFDFNIASCLNRPGRKAEKWPTTRPLNPLYSCWHYVPDSFEAFIPEPHRSRVEVWRGWVKRRWYNSKEFSSFKEAEALFMWKPENEVLPVEYVEPFPDPTPEEKARNRWRV